MVNSPDTLQRGQLGLFGRAPALLEGEESLEVDPMLAG